MQAAIIAGVPDFDTIIGTALVDLDGDNITGDGATIAWPNSGTGGAGYDVDGPFGTTANLTTITVNSRTVMQSSGAAGIQTGTAQTISAPFTLIAAARFTDATPSTNQNLVDSRNSATNRLLLHSKDASSDKFGFDAGGGGVTMAEAYDTNPRIWVMHQTGSSTANLTVDGVGAISGGDGSNDFEYITLFSRYDGAGSTDMIGWIGRVLIWTGGILPGHHEVAVVNRLKSDYGI